jgi:hypothetical protein
VLDLTRRVEARAGVVQECRFSPTLLSTSPSFCSRFGECSSSTPSQGRRTWTGAEGGVSRRLVVSSLSRERKEVENAPFSLATRQPTLHLRRPEPPYLIARSSRAAEEETSFPRRCTFSRRCFPDFRALLFVSLNRNQLQDGLTRQSTRYATLPSHSHHRQDSRRRAREVGSPTS